MASSSSSLLLGASEVPSVSSSSSGFLEHSVVETSYDISELSNSGTDCGIHTSASSPGRGKPGTALSDRQTFRTGQHMFTSPSSSSMSLWLSVSPESTSSSLVTPNKDERYQSSRKHLDLEAGTPRSQAELPQLDSPSCHSSQLTYDSPSKPSTIVSSWDTTLDQNRRSRPSEQHGRRLSLKSRFLGMFSASPGSATTSPKPADLPSSGNCSTSVDSSTASDTPGSANLSQWSTAVGLPASTQSPSIVSHSASTVSLFSNKSHSSTRSLSSTRSESPSSSSSISRSSAGSVSRSSTRSVSRSSTRSVSRSRGRSISQSSSISVSHPSTRSASPGSSTGSRNASPSVLLPSSPGRAKLESSTASSGKYQPVLRFTHDSPVSRAVRSQPAWRQSLSKPSLHSSPNTRLPNLGASGPAVQNYSEYIDVLLSGSDENNTLVNTTIEKSFDATLMENYDKASDSLTDLTANTAKALPPANERKPSKLSLKSKKKDAKLGPKCSKKVSETKQTITDFFHVDGKESMTKPGRIAANTGNNVINISDDDDDVVITHYKPGDRHPLCTCHLKKKNVASEHQHEHMAKDTHAAHVSGHKSTAAHVSSNMAPATHGSSHMAQASGPVPEPKATAETAKPKQTTCRRRGSTRTPCIKLEPDCQDDYFQYFNNMDPDHEIKFKHKSPTRFVHPRHCRIV